MTIVEQTRPRRDPVRRGPGPLRRHHRRRDDRLRRRANAAASKRAIGPPVGGDDLATWSAAAAKSIRLADLRAAHEGFFPG